MSGGRDDDRSGTDGLEIAHETIYHLTSYILQRNDIQSSIMIVSRDGKKMKR